MTQRQAPTIFDKTRTPLTVWFAAAWLLVNSKTGVSATQPRREMELGSVQTAWAMLHRYRTVMARTVAKGLRLRPKGLVALISLTRRHPAR
jgi:hypothetical protein